MGLMTYFFIYNIVWVWLFGFLISYR